MYTVTNLDHKTDACKLTRSKTCRNTTFTWLKHARPSTKSRDIIVAQSRGSYQDKVTVYPYNGHITDTNLHVRPSNICGWALAMLHIKLCKLNQATQCLIVTGTDTKKCWKSGNLESYYWHWHRHRREAIRYAFRAMLYKWTAWWWGY